MSDEQRLARLKQSIMRTITNPGKRSAQASIGPSEIASTCDYCVGRALTRKYPEYWWEHAPFREGHSHKAWIGTAIHEKLDRDHSEGRKEGRVFITHLEGYGDIHGHCDLYQEQTVVDYKGLPLDTEIPTPAGWTTMGGLSVGDEVFDADGRTVRVTQKSQVHQRKCYRITFDDTSEVICDDEHLWAVTSGHGKHKKEQVLNTEQIKDTLTLHGQKQHRVRVASSLDLPKIDLPIDPYTFGCWLGDGNKYEGNICKPDDELFELIEAQGYRIGPPMGKDNRKVRSRTVYGLRTQLRKAGVLKNKHVPRVFLRASKEQRLALLQGLMDTDGSWNSTRSQAVFVTTDRHLAEAVHELAVSLGQRALISTTSQTGFGKTVTAYPVSFKPVRGVNPFRLSRKREKVSVKSEVRSTQRIIKSVEEVDPVQTQCIAVDSPTETYLCTRSMIPTHNTKDLHKIDEIRLEGPPASEIFQIFTYGYGYALTGADVKDVMLVYIPRDTNDADEVEFFVAPYDPRVAERALARLSEIWDKVRSNRGNELERDTENCFTCSRIPKKGRWW